MLGEYCGKLIQLLSFKAFKKSARQKMGVFMVMDAMLNAAAV
jgi:hypothetical protein